MSRFPRAAGLDEVPAAARALLEPLPVLLTAAPDYFLTLAASPAALQAVLAMSAATAKGGIATATRERIGIAVSMLNGDGYSGAAYAGAARNQGLSDEEVAANGRGRSSDPEADAAVRFARKVVEARGRITDTDLAAIRNAGYTDAQAIELVLQVGLATLSNYLVSLFGLGVESVPSA